jgi:hypothetical protein
MDLARRVALVLIRLHPPAWRRRYADEVSALVEQSPATPRSLVDLARSGAGEWTRAGWRSVVIAPGRWPHPGRVAGLSVLTVVALFVGTSLATFVEIAYYVSLLLSYGMPERAMEILAGQMNAFRPGTRLPPLSVVGIFDVFAFTFLWFGLPALPVIVGGRISGLGRRFPLTTRLAVALAFSTIAIWLLPARTIAGTLFAGWVLASGFFPRRPAARPGANSTPMVNA